MFKFYECKVGATYEKEICSPECLAQLAVYLTPRALDSAFCTCGMFMDSGRTDPATCEFCGKPQSQ